MVPVDSTCMECLFRLIEQTANAGCVEEEARRRAIAAASDYVVQHRAGAPSAAHLANRFHPLIREICNNPDPFKERKQREMERAAELADAHRPAPDAGLLELVGFAALGNVIDFFRPPDEIEGWLHSAPVFAENHIDALEHLLAGGPRRILCLADNAGEVFFDVPLLQALAKTGHHVEYVVKSGPVQNDLARRDLEPWIDRVGVPVIDTGAATVGLEIEETSDEFRERYRRADLIVAKGMGHAETLGDTDDPRIFLLFLVKCKPVANALGIPYNHFAAFFPARNRQ